MTTTLPYWTAVRPEQVTGTARFAPNFLGLNPYIIGSHVVPITIDRQHRQDQPGKLEATWHNDDTMVHFGAHFVQDVWDSSIGTPSRTTSGSSGRATDRPRTTSSITVIGLTTMRRSEQPGPGASRSRTALPCRRACSHPFDPELHSWLQRQWQSASVTAPVQPVLRAQLSDHAADQCGRYTPNAGYPDYTGGDAGAGAEPGLGAARGSQELRPVRHRAAHLPARAT